MMSNLRRGPKKQMLPEVKLDKPVPPILLEPAPFPDFPMPTKVGLLSVDPPTSKEDREVSFERWLTAIKSEMDVRWASACAVFGISPTPQDDRLSAIFDRIFPGFSLKPLPSQRDQPKPGKWGADNDEALRTYKRALELYLSDDQSWREKSARQHAPSMSEAWRHACGESGRKMSVKTIESAWQTLMAFSVMQLISHAALGELMGVATVDPATIDRRAARRIELGYVNQMLDEGLFKGWRAAKPRKA